MADLSNYCFTGRVAKDAEFKVLSSGKKLLQLTVANNVGFGDFAKTNWLTVKMWGDRGEKIAQYLKKGTTVTGAGELSTEDWTGSDGKTRTNIVITVMNIQFSGGKKSDGDDISADDNVTF